MNILEIEDLLISIFDLLNYEDQINYLLAFSFAPKRLCDKLISILRIEFQSDYQTNYNRFRKLVIYPFEFEHSYRCYDESYDGENFITEIICRNKMNSLGQDESFQLDILNLDKLNRRELVTLYQTILINVPKLILNRIQRKNKNKVDRLFLKSRHMLRRIDYSFLKK